MLGVSLLTAFASGRLSTSWQLAISLRPAQIMRSFEVNNIWLGVTCNDLFDHFGYQKQATLNTRSASLIGVPLVRLRSNVVTQAQNVGLGSQGR